MLCLNSSSVFHSILIVGKPAPLYLTYDVDWTPSMLLWHQKLKEDKQLMGRYKRREERRRKLCIAKVDGSSKGSDEFPLVMFDIYGATQASNKM